MSLIPSLTPYYYSYFTISHRSRSFAFAIITSIFLLYLYYSKYLLSTTPFQLVMVTFPPQDYHPFESLHPPFQYAIVAIFLSSFCFSSLLLLIPMSILLFFLLDSFPY